MLQEADELDQLPDEGSDMESGEQEAHSNLPSREGQRRTAAWYLARMHQPIYDGVPMLMHAARPRVVAQVQGQVLAAF